MRAVRQPGIVHGHGDIIAGAHILSAGDNLDGRARADVDLTGKHVVGIRVADDLCYLADDDVFDLCALRLIPFHLGAGHGHRFGEFVGGNPADIHIVGEPFH